MGLLHKAENQMAYMKVGIQGFAASGKTRTAIEIAKGVVLELRAMGKAKNCIAFFDTETGSDFYVGEMAALGIDFQVAKSRSYTDLMQVCTEAQDVADVFIADSVTHCWEELVEGYKAKKKTNRLAFQDWGIIKPTWNKFTTFLVNSPLHMIICGRGGYEYDYFEGDDGSMELYKTGTKMKAGGEIGFEPSLLIEMERIKDPAAYQAYKEAHGKQNKAKAAERIAGSKVIVNRATILKDRNPTETSLNGLVIDMPTFEPFKPHWDYLNIGGTHRQLDDQSSSSELFDNEGKPEWRRNKDQAEILLEEIQNDLVKLGLGSTAKEKVWKVQILETAFGTGSWKSIEAMELMRLEYCRSMLNKIITDIKPILALSDPSEKMKEYFEPNE